METKNFKNPAILRVILLAGGIIATGIACAILFVPQAFYAN